MVGAAAVKACGADAGPVSESEQEAARSVPASTSALRLKNWQLDMVAPKASGLLWLEPYL